LVIYPLYPLLSRRRRCLRKSGRKINVKKLVDSMIEIREKVKKLYSEYVHELNCNEWFENLYEIREMSIYKKGSKLEVLGRSWWV
jgi:hypothetical protein